MSKSELFESDSPCSYFPDGRTASFVLPEAPIRQESLSPARIEDLRLKKFANLARGLNTEGIYSIALSCKFCRACVPIRINTDKASFSRSQQKLLNNGNKNLIMTSGPSYYDSDFLRLYSRYIHARHPESDMAKYGAEDVKDTILGATDLMLIKDKENNFLALATMDIYDNTISLGQIFYDPDQKLCASLGTYAWLKIIDCGKKAGFKYLYPGSWADKSKTLGYKQRFPGLETIVDGQWVNFDPETHRTGPDLVSLITAEPAT